ncbi:uncharacterized protein N7459_000675 [Penicillium hispanicum]|uniref:uncharacterized protein n=1 Tax=Penicillium hispanicum TaxID=1080232 RepID=UPI00254195DB|nr:uncharacterized protein N7459_000675 [Penicillium hispanicum]KAJ5594467.1 hypothetical protein N7459_000675 [Penicillium hispanicum]
MSTPNPRGRRSLRNSGVGPNTPGERSLTGFQRLPSHTRYPLTPSRLITSVALSAQRSASQYTPGARVPTVPSTPYGLRAQQQRAANTPARDRRRSGRMQRETTFDILKNLGRALAPVSQPIQSSPQEIPLPTEEPTDEIEELENEPDIELPRLSLPIEEVEEESAEASPEMRPPRMSLAFEDDDITYQSIEYPRRDLADRDRDRLSTVSRMAGRISEDFGEARSESDDEGDETGIPGDEDDNVEDTMISGADFDQGGETEDLGRFHFDMDFPSPSAPAPDDPMDGHSEEIESFELAAPDVQPLAGSLQSDDGNDAGGDFGFGLNFPQAVSPSQTPGLIGGGLRDDGPHEHGKQKKLSRHGIPVPNLPIGVTKRLATRFARTRAGSQVKIDKAALAAIEQASSWFFEQASQDLAAYSKHAGRKTIDENDVTTLMRRQRHINGSTTVFSLAQKHLPKELQQDMRLAMPP